MTLYVVPQLPVKGRYQEFWIDWWVKELNNLKFRDYKVLTPEGGWEPVSFTPNDKEYFAPVIESIAWEGEVAKRLANELKNMKAGDVILFLDFDFTGMWQGLIPLIRRYNPYVQLAAYVHAGSWGEGDYFEPVRRSKMLIELGSALELDYMFFPTYSVMMDALSYFVELIGWFNYKLLKERSYVVGTLWRPGKRLQEIRSCKEKRNAVFVNGRWQNMVNSKMLDSVVKILKKHGVEVYATNVKVSERLKVPHIDYYEALRICKVMLQPKNYETFGLAVVEALYTYTIPCLSDIPTYRELYDSFIGWAVEDVLDRIENYGKYLIIARNVISRIWSRLNCVEKILKILNLM